MKPSETSIIAESKKQKQKKHIWFMSLLIILIGGSFYIWNVFNSSEEKITEIKTTTVQRGGLKVSIEGEGKIINPNIVNLSFLINGTLDEIFVQEGEKVSKGDILATLDKRDLTFDLQDAQTQVGIVRSNIQAKEASITDSALLLAKNDIVISQKNLERTRQELQQNLDQAFDLGILQLETAFPKFQRALESIDDIFGLDQNGAPYYNVINIFNDSINENQVKTQYRTNKQKFDDLWTEYENLVPLKNEDISRYLWKTKTFATELQTMFQKTVDLFDNTKPNSRVSQSEVDQARNSVQTSLSSIDNEINALTSSKQKIENAYLSYQTGLQKAEDSFETTQLKLENTQKSTEEAELSKEMSLSNLYAQLAQAQVKVEKAKYNLELTTLLSPIDGEIIVVNGNPGEAVKSDSTSSDNALIRILSENNFTTEVYIEEMDIAKIQKGQKTYITLDALPDTTLEGEVVYIASTATISNNGITTYLVRVQITDTKNTDIKEGMSTYVEFVSEEAKDVLYVPEKSVRRNRVKLVDGNFVDVETGMSDGQYIEIKNGLTEGQEILEDPSMNKDVSSQGGTGMGSSELSEERFERIESMLREQGTLPEGWESMSPEEKQSALTKLRESGGLSGGRGMGAGMRPSR